MTSHSLSQFRSYQLAVQVYRLLAALQLPGRLRDQLLRAASSVALNLSEGSAKPTAKDRLKFYFIALGSLREVQAVIDLAPHVSDEVRLQVDQLGACVYRLTHPK